MTNVTLAELDREQLLQAALIASAGGDSIAAIACLTEALRRPDATALTHYLLGAEYAQVQQYDRAIAQLESALALDGGLHVARLQLGMMYLGAHDEARGVERLASLEALDESQPLRHFAGGLQRLVRGEPAAALAALGRGISLNAEFPALNGDMRRIMDGIERQGMADGAEGSDRAGAADPGTEAASAPVAEEGGQHVLLFAYTFNRMH